MTPWYRLFALASRMSRPAPGVLFVQTGSNAEIEEQRLEPVEQVVDRLAAAEREARAAAGGRVRRGAKRLRACT